MRVLIPDILDKNVLAGIRALGRAGCRVTLGLVPGPGATSAASSGWRGRVNRRLLTSRYCQRVLPLTSPFVDADRYIRDLMALLQRDRYQVVLPFSLTAVGCCIRAKSALEILAPIPFPDWETFLRVHDKYRIIQLARRVGVPVPRTWCPRFPEELEALQGQLPFPLVIKARRGSGVFRGLRYVADWKELRRSYEELRTQDGAMDIYDYRIPLIQEYIPGAVHDALLLVDRRGGIRAAMTQMREVTYPVSGGPGTVVRTTHEPDLIDHARTLLTEAGWWGPVMCEFKRHAQDGQPRLMEVNPKFWGTLGLAIRAGINFPHLACQLAVTGELPRVSFYRRNLTYRWILRDELRSLSQEWKQPAAMAAFLGRFLRSGTVYDIAPDDPGPDLWMFLGALKALRGRGRQRSTGGA